MSEALSAPVARRLRAGGVIPAHPLALDSERRLDERRQRALTRYYLDAGAIGVAIGVHTTQFSIRQVGLLGPVLALGAATVKERTDSASIVTIAGVVGATSQAVREARLARDLGYSIALLSLGGLGSWSDRALLRHVRAVAEILPVMGFYLQPAVGGRPLGYAFWRGLATIDRVVAIKVAPFNRYQTLDVVRAVVDEGRLGDIALYTGNDDAIVTDLVQGYRLRGPNGRATTARFVGGLLGHWAFWTRRAVDLVSRCHAARAEERVPPSLLALAAATTDANAAAFDAANGFRGCIPGIHEMLRHQGLLRGRWCLDRGEVLSPGQRQEIERVRRAYPFLADDGFVRQHLDRWLRP